MKALKERGSRLLELVIAVLCVLVVVSTVAFAEGELMTYNGEGIMDKDSIGKFTLEETRTFTVYHNTSSFPVLAPGSTGSVTISLLRKGAFFFNETGDEFTVVGVAAGYKRWTKTAGTYKLHFRVDGSNYGILPTANINGRVV